MIGTRLHHMPLWAMLALGLITGCGQSGSGQDSTPAIETAPAKAPETPATEPATKADPPKTQAGTTVHARELVPLANDGIAQLIAYGSVLAVSDQDDSFSHQLRIYAFPEVLGECMGKVISCPDWRLVFTLSPGDLYDKQKAFELPKAKGWEFVKWVSPADPEAGSFVVRTALPTANIDDDERQSWKPAYYKVTVTVDQAASEVLAGPE